MMKLYFTFAYFRVFEVNKYSPVLNHVMSIMSYALSKKKVKKAHQSPTHSHTSGWN